MRADEPPHRMTELGTTLRLAKSSLTELVDRTAQRGLVRREPDPSDGRAVVVALTGHGACDRRQVLRGDLRADRRGAVGARRGDRAALAELLGRVVMDNTVSTIFLDWDDDVHPRRESLFVIRTIMVRVPNFNEGIPFPAGFGKSRRERRAPAPGRGDAEDLTGLRHAHQIRLRRLRPAAPAPAAGDRCCPSRAARRPPSSTASRFASAGSWPRARATASAAERTW